MQLIIPFAASHSFSTAGDLDSMHWPHLQVLLGLVRPQQQWQDDPAPPYYMPHEQALARALGWTTDQASLPWAALHATRQGLASGQAWAWMTPCHWQVGMDQVVMSNPQGLSLTDAQSIELMQALAPLLRDDGLHLHWHDRLHWLLEGNVLHDLATASLDRVIGQNVKHWLPRGPAARTLARLQSEMQMLLYHHPVNEAREQLGQAPVNAFWLHGAGRLQMPAPPPVTHAQMPMLLRESALRGDLKAWRQAWQDVDAGPVAALLDHVQRTGEGTLILCSETRAHSLVAHRAGWLDRLQRKWRPPSVIGHLQELTLP
jgi:hypothetical protein